jgi:hypothetical protein
MWPEAEMRLPVSLTPKKSKPSSLNLSFFICDAQSEKMFRIARHAWLSCPSPLMR